MARENQTTQYKSLIESVAGPERTPEEVSEFRWSGFNTLEPQSVMDHKSMIYPEMLERTLGKASEYPALESRKQASVKFGRAPMPPSFNLPAVFSVYINRVGASPQSLVAAVGLLVSIVDEHKHQPIPSLAAEDCQSLTYARDKLLDIVGEDENHFLTPLINFIDNLIKIHDEEFNPATRMGLLSQETDDSDHTDAATLKPHRPEKVGRPTTLPRLKLADLLSQETDDSDHTDAATLKPHRPEKVGRPTTLPRLKLADLLSQETDDSASGEVDTGPAVGNEVW